MNWENPSFETLKKFETFIKLLKTLNELDSGTRQEGRFSWHFSKDSLYIDGIPDSLGNLFSLLWTRNNHYSLYFFQEEGKSMIEVIYH